MTNKCNVSKCTDESKQWGLCSKHFQQLYYVENKARINNRNNDNYKKNAEHVKARTNGNKRTPVGRWCRLREGARNRGIEVKITMEQHQELLKLPCDYCGGELPRSGAGVDRVDSSRPYEMGNLVPCCKRCNQAKNDLPLAEFRELVTKIYENFQRKASQSK